MGAFEWHKKVGESQCRVRFFVGQLFCWCVERRISALRRELLPMAAPVPSLRATSPNQLNPQASLWIVLRHSLAHSLEHKRTSVEGYQQIDGGRASELATLFEQLWCLSLFKLIVF